MSKEEIKLEAGQIWQDGDEYVRQLKFVGEDIVVFSFLNKQHPKKEVYCSIEYFTAVCKKDLLPCWPPKPAFETKPLASNVAFYLDKDCNLIIPREMLLAITEAVNRASFELTVKKMEPVK